jgi:hypothetical protein
MFHPYIKQIDGCDKNTYQGASISREILTIINGYLGYDLLIFN